MIGETIFASISHQSKSIKSSVNLKFRKKNIGFLNPILLSTMEIKEDNDDFQVTFFKDTRFSQSLDFNVINNKSFALKSSEEVRLMRDEEFPPCQQDAFAAVITCKSLNLDNEDIAKVSRLVRDSETLKREDLTELPNEWRNVDGRGIALLEKYDLTDQPFRLCLLYALGIAYRYAMQQMMEKLSELLAKDSLTHFTEISDLYGEIAQFNARYYYDNPVVFKNYPTFKAWGDIRDALKLPTLNEEVTQQLSQVHQILGFHLQQKLDKRSKRNTLIISGIGIILALGELAAAFS